MTSEFLAPTRRGFLRGALTLLAAPAIVRISSIMPVRPWLSDRIPILALPSDFKVTDFYGIDYNATRMGVIRDLILPGLRDLDADCVVNRRAWAELFASKPRLG